MSRKIFISYRRSDSADFTVALYNQLREHFEESYLFKDINTIQPGEQFADVLAAALDDCVVVLVVIGPQWIEGSGHRLFEEHDWVRQEISWALSRNLRVIPILANGTKMPPTDKLPADLHGLCSRQALAIDNQRFEYDVAQLCHAIQDLVPKRKRLHRPLVSGWDHAFKAILLLFMLGSIALISWAWLGGQGTFAEKIAMSILGLGGMAGGWAAFTRQRWIELRSNQLEEL
jgi:TIR domain